MKTNQNPCDKFLCNLTKTKFGSKNDNIYRAFSLLLHRLMRSNKFVNVAFDFSIGIPYHNALYLHDYWALEEFESQPVCAVEIAEGKA